MHFTYRSQTLTISKRFVSNKKKYFHASYKCAFQVASSLFPSTSVANIFGNWLYGIDLKFRRLIRVEALAIIWSLWLCRNEKVFNDLLQIIYRCTSILCLWSPL
jgi:hypothetical protein